MYEAWVEQVKIWEESLVQIMFDCIQEEVFGWINGWIFFPMQNVKDRS